MFYAAAPPMLASACVYFAASYPVVGGGHDRSLSSNHRHWRPLLARPSSVCSVDQAGCPTSIGLHSVTIGDRGTELLLRFDRPINHVTSWLSLVRDGQIVETVHFRLETAPNVLFARIRNSGARQLHCALDGVPGRQQRQTRGRIAVHGRPGIQYR